jgi:hypothetical protein
MKISWKLLCILSGLVLALSTGRAADRPCPAGCATQAVTCLKSARAGKASCRMDCRANASGSTLGACVRGCADAFRSAHGTCRDEQGGCLQACRPSSSAGGAFVGSCLGGCGHDLGSCAHHDASTLAACIRGCADGVGRRSCIAGCVATARSSAEGCASDFDGCRSGCGGTTTTTTPGDTTTTTVSEPGTTTTTRPEAPGCGDARDGTCGGRCPTPGQVCREVSGACTCTTPGTR